MHPVTEMETSVPAFLGKLWRLVEDPETDDLICWAPNGRSFSIRNQAQFARELLPHYYKHNNMASFVRQLNMYGFHKKVSVELGGLKCDRDEMEFAHQYFIKGHPYLLEHIKRKIASTKSQDTSHPPMKSEMMNKVLSEVRTMRGRQEHLDSRLGAMKRENEALWRELAILRRKHLKQQEIVNKLIHFLVTLVQPSRSSGLPVKRRYPLMIDNVNHIRNKQSKLSKPEASPTGPVIHELDASEHDMDPEFINIDMFESHSNPAIQSPDPDEFASMADENLVTVEMMENAMSKPENARSLRTRVSQKIKPKEKKKRKNKMPVKILIPATESGEQAREETLMLEMNPEGEEVSLPVIEIVEEPAKKEMKPVPVKTLRSSKLAAMAANINKMNDADDPESSEEVDDMESRECDSEMAKLEDIFTLPDDLRETSNLRDDPPSNSSGPKRPNSSSNWKNMSGTMNWSKKNTEQNVDRRSDDDNSVSNLQTDFGTYSPAGSTSNSKDLTLSRVSPSAKSDVPYSRLGSVEDVDNHLESMQNELENLREVLRGEGYSIDANTLLGLFGADDPMSFGIPVNPELNPQREREEDERSTDNSSYVNAGGELMAYTPSTSLLDFDDDIFLGQTGEASPSGELENTNANSYYNNEDSLDLENGKASLLASLVDNADANSATS